MKSGVTITGPILGAQAAIVGAFSLGLARGWFPLGVPGEWEWLRLGADIHLDGFGILFAVLALTAYALYVAFGFRLLQTRAGRFRETSAIGTLAVAAFLLQGLVQSAAPPGYGLAKWIIALHQRGSSGYFWVATQEVGDLKAFLKAYPEWIKTQDPLHIGTHPPGLIVIERALFSFFASHPEAVRLVDDLSPGQAALAAKVFQTEPPLRPADRATLITTGALIMLLCAATVLPLYALARTWFAAEAAWAVAALWPLVPSAILFQPTSDTAFPFLSSLAIAGAVVAGRSTIKPIASDSFALVSGLVLGLGMQLSLVFAAIGLIVGLDITSNRERSSAARLRPLAMVAIGFFGLTLLIWWLTESNPFSIWSSNQRNHARFYATYPRTYHAWVIENPLELAVGIGLPSVVLIGLSLRWPRSIPAVTMITAGVLIYLTLSGKSLSEIGRLWLPFMPILLLAAAIPVTKLRLGPKSLGGIVFLTGLQGLVMESLIQVVYPV